MAQSPEAAAATRQFGDSVGGELSGGDDTFYLEQVTLDDDDDDAYQYETVELDDDDVAGEGEEDLDQALRTLKLKKGMAVEDPPPPPERPEVHLRAEVVDDFVRNFLRKMGLHGTLDMFQREWYTLQQEGKLEDEDIGTVPDVYLRNQHLRDEVKAMKEKMEKMEQIAQRARSTWDKFRKERDFHKMHHKRVVQEKNKLITDLKRLKKHYEDYEPTLAAMRKKYEAAMKEKMMMKLERDRLKGKVAALEHQVQQLEAIRPASEAEPTRTPKPRAQGATLPKQPRPNPNIGLKEEPRMVETFHPQTTNKGHDAGVAAVAHHPTKPIIATASDDCTWKLWTVPGGDLVMSGDGHTDWLSSVEFHPHGSHLATGSGDATVKLWDFRTASCSATLADHTQAVWDVAWHDLGDFVVSASMDHTAKLWDAVVGKCRATFRGHVDSINSVCFQPFSENICTGSGDKTVSLWDCRTALCIQTFYGHMNACSSVAFSSRGDRVASTDADGVVKLWDVRKVSELCQVYAGPHPANSCAFDRTGSLLAVASDDGTIKVFNVDTAASIALGEADETAEAHMNDLRGHEEPVQSICFEPVSNRYLVSGSSDATVKVW
eukprot:CAMPEP_0185182896 /NCGR_PEP_ID=MMETSP1140-20130426/1640_1 /TAXON_ID=298111 /ORGANISM="Pavlova sp., Strain CCMP459" /LENGTH=603 /DNA_ID=CAMNT_0027748867 /DNA_START=26 /DNA_END=1834 /DNA_ORIENTATION=+